jgi:methylated-DNA-[protein]-cysteine S-methyltransferase
MLYTTHPFPIGELMLAGDGEALASIHLPGCHPPASLRLGWRRDPEPFEEAIRQLEQYFAGERSEFDLPLRPEGGAFERRVWEELRLIPFGSTTTYGEIARRVGHPAAARAVGRANAHNPIAIVVPCHRVIGRDGTLTGYAGGLDCKRTLLDLERGVESLSLAADPATSAA